MEMLNNCKITPKLVEIIQIVINLYEHSHLSWICFQLTSSHPYCHASLPSRPGPVIYRHSCTSEKICHVKYTRHLGIIPSQMQQNIAVCLLAEKSWSAARPMPWLVWFLCLKILRLWWILSGIKIRSISTSWWCLLLCYSVEFKEDIDNIVKHTCPYSWVNFVQFLKNNIAYYEFQINEQ